MVLTLRSALRIVNRTTRALEIHVGSAKPAPDDDDNDASSGLFECYCHAQADGVDSHFACRRLQAAWPSEQDAEAAVQRCAKAWEALDAGGVADV